ncbi:MAG TPA: RnfABCDGE type electron transport complex subunit D [Bacteroidetes bacterium]|nr:RnfABCDGE type electron transport complex subunit D [Candidatus Limimorpha avicola]
MNQFTISGSPHVHGEESTKKIMYSVVIAMLPMFLVSIYFFGLNALRVVAISVASCLLIEWLIQKYMIKGPNTISDGSALVTGMLLAFNVPANIPWWMLVIGAAVSIGIAKMSFGGLGKNPFNPALVGRVFMLISFPVAMTTWPVPHPVFSNTVLDAVTGPTPLGILKEGLAQGLTVEEITKNIDYIDLLIGNRGGSLAEMCAIAILIGGLFLIIRRVIDWQTPVIIIATVAIIAGICWLINPAQYVNPLYHILSGGLLLGAFFMATDMVTTPMTMGGKIVFSIGVGALTIIIRLWGAYPEGMSFAILIMNAFVPLINKGFKPKRFGLVKK